MLDKADISEFMEHLFTKNDSWFFDKFEVAQKCAKIFFQLNNTYYAGFGSAQMFAAVGDCLKYCLERGYLERQDFFATDDEVIKKIKAHLDDEKLKLLFARMNNRVKATNDHGDFDQRVLCKSRAVDPFFKDGENIKRVSEVDAPWAAALKGELKPKEYFVKFEK